VLLVSHTNHHDLNCAWLYRAPRPGGVDMTRKRKQKERALNLPGARLDVVGAVVGLARSSARSRRQE
jgi:hypothetical protein